MEVRPAEDKQVLTAAFVTAGVAAVAVGFGVGYGVAALNDQSSYNKTPTSSLLDSCRTEAMLADVGFGVAVAAAATSAVLFYRALSRGWTSQGAPASDPTPSVMLAPVVGAHSAGVGLSLRF
jgi:hypothetical protein